MTNIPRTEFAQALKAITSERGLDASIILEAIQAAIVAAYRRDAKERGEETEEFEFDVEINPKDGGAKIFSWPEGKENEKKEVTPPGFGRIAAQTAKQVIRQKIREAEKGAIMDEFSDRIGTLISGMVLRFEGGDVRVDLGRTEAIMPASERVQNEHLVPNQRYTFLLRDIEETLRGKLIILSRSNSKFVAKLFEREVPEMSTGSVEVKLIAREAGVRTKMVVSSNQSGVDPVGSCVGQKGVRVQAVTNELGGERVDIIPWNEDVKELIKAALSPAEELSVTLDEKTKTATVHAPEDQLSLAIGKDGQNARLAAKLTDWKITVEGTGEESEKGKIEKKKMESQEKSNSDEKESKDKEKEDSKKKVKKETKEKKSKTKKVKEEKKEVTSEKKKSEGKEKSEEKEVKTKKEETKEKEKKEEKKDEEEKSEEK